MYIRDNQLIRYKERCKLILIIFRFCRIRIWSLSRRLIGSCLLMESLASLFSIGELLGIFRTDLFFIEDI